VVFTRPGRGCCGGAGVPRATAPPGHAQSAAGREAGRELAAFALTGATLYASCEPCPMCLATSPWARVAAVHYAADRHAAAAAGFGDAAFYDFIAGKDRSLMRVVHTRHGDALAPFAAWERYERRVEY